MIRLIFCLILILLGMFGLWQHVEYSGWVLFLGLATIPVFSED